MTQLALLQQGEKVSLIFVFIRALNQVEAAIRTAALAHIVAGGDGIKAAQA